MQGHFQKAFWIFTGILLVIMAGFLILYQYCAYESDRTRTYSYSELNQNVPQDGLSFSMTASEPWMDEKFHPQKEVGAQYDCIVYNTSNQEFRNWSVELVLSEEPQIDSSWNGDFATNGRVLHFTAAKDNNDGRMSVLPPEGAVNFGSVMYAARELSVRSCTITGKFKWNMTDCAAFWVLLTAGVLWGLGLMLHLILSYHASFYKKQQQVDMEIINQLMGIFTSFIDAKDGYTRGHSARVAAYSAEIGRRMHMSQEEVDRLYNVALMHDCGKIGIPDAVLKKPGKLDPDEYGVIKAHTTMGNHMLHDFKVIPGMSDGAYYHHERYDGTGYPRGIAGKSIPLYARIICVADSYDAMSTNRCYRQELGKEEILRELKINKGRQFDPDIVCHMVDMIREGYTERVMLRIPGNPREELLEMETG